VIIVGGTFEVDPDQREAFLAQRHEVMRRSRAEAGCLDYTFAADPLEPGRVILFERWESQEHLDAHLVALRAARPAPSGDEVTASKTTVILYDVAAEQALGR
jgi:quinol monooxygenase YgiN